MFLKKCFIFLVVSIFRKIDKVVLLPKMAIRLSLEGQSVIVLNLFKAQVES